VTETPDENAVLQSTTWEWKLVKISQRRTAPGKKRGGAAFWLSLSPRRARTPLPCVVLYRGGPEAWVEVRARGGVLRVPGSTSVFDVLRAINNAADL